MNTFIPCPRVMHNFETGEGIECPGRVEWYWDATGTEVWIVESCSVHGSLHSGEVNAANYAAEAAAEAQQVPCRYCRRPEMQCNCP